MSRYILDTDICSYVMRRSHAKLMKRLRERPVTEQAISAITAAELLFGARLCPNPSKVMESYDRFIRHLAVLNWDAAAAVHYADIRADLQRRGLPIGANDLLIAAHARSLGATLVTNNVSEFARVRNLRVENWVN